MDNSSGTYQIWTPKWLSMLLASKTGETAVPSGISRLDQKLPGIRSIRRQIFAIESLNILRQTKYYNILGDLVKSLVSETQAPC
ncbi:MAG: hypothetical protein R3C41_21010 [Calditrichia bacterium]